jgi:hypothetical protein
MNSKLILVCLLLLVVTTSRLTAQTGNNISVVPKDDPLAVKLTQNLSETDTYVWPKDPKVMENLKKWQGYKFGLLIHMRLYSELGIVESGIMSQR